MRATSFEKLRGQLLELQRRLRGDVAAIRDEARGHGDFQGSHSRLPNHLAELGSDSFEQTMAIHLLENEAGMLEETDEALRRMADGTFGRCAQCHTDIPEGRLELLPYTPFCVSCARQQEAHVG
jgi:DnaK suppressor protein